MIKFTPGPDRLARGMALCTIVIEICRTMVWIGLRIKFILMTHIAVCVGRVIVAAHVTFIVGTRQGCMCAHERKKCRIVIKCCRLPQGLIMTGGAVMAEGICAM
jgi:hypothetical protein